MQRSPTTRSALENGPDSSSSRLASVGYPTGYTFGVGALAFLGANTKMPKARPQDAFSSEPIAADSTWSDAELLATVAAYKDVFDRVRSGLPVNKAATYRDLSGRFGRTPGAYERRMQNISAVLDEMGAPWLPGLLPMRNIGTHVRPRLVNIVRDRFKDGIHSPPAYDPEVVELLTHSSLSMPIGEPAPVATVRQVTDYARDAKVKAWVLRQANGRCESCGSSAPFRTIEGLPYLEVHHVRTLAARGPDTIDNTVALCPNCHRRLHYGDDAIELREALLAKIDRLRAAS